jgi:valyl-tRNA synthetase
MSAQEIPSEYDPHGAATRWSRAWDDAGIFTPSPDSPGEPFCIVIPPPNVTGALHMGHALNNTLQDVLVRYKRMCGFNALWVPGMDHAGIATQKVVRDRLAERGVDWRGLGRSGFVDEVWRWKAQSGGMISSQLRRLGVSCDWTRERFTLDEGLHDAVIEHFVRLYEQGLIYRAERLISWDPVDRTALSDLEVDNVEAMGELFSFAYALSDGSGEIVVATTRPETMLGDTAVAVHPDDERYKHLIGRTVRHPFNGRAIPIIADSILVDPAFGTGCVKITPAHDFNDFEVGKRHGLPTINILERDGTLNAEGGPFAGLDRFVAREQVKARLAELGLVRGAQPHPLKLPTAQRSGAIVEPMLSTQWFVHMKPLAGPALAAVEHGFTNFVPKQWENTYYAWLRDIQDWCISRQLWWGHRIPAWYDDAGQVYVARTFEQACAQAGHDRLTQDDDVLDTWFSSALWPFSTLGWPDRTADLARWYPTSVLVTGFDIIFFWVARMMFAGLHFTGSVPFRDVYIHALVRDEHGDKMSKSKGNVVDPLVAIDRSGADAFRFTMVAMAAQGRDILWNESRVEASGRFIHKMWQALRFCFLTGEGYDAAAPMAFGPYEHWIRARTGAAVGRVRDALDEYRFNDAASEIHAFVWGELCDWYLELSKTTLYDTQASDAHKNGTRHTLFSTMGVVARLIQPLMPFLSEEIWSRLPGTSGLAATAPFPTVAEFPIDLNALAEIADLQAVIVEVRRIRGEMQIARKVPLRVLVADAGLVARLAPHAGAVEHLVNAEVVHAAERPTAVAVAVARGVELAIPLEGVIDLDEERARLDKELVKLDKDVLDLEKRLSNRAFVDRAPADIVAGFQEKLDASRARQAALRASRDRLGA